MGKKDKKISDSKAASKVAKKEKAAKSAEKQRDKKAKKTTTDGDEEDLEAILEKYQKEMQENLSVTEEILEEPPSRRANGTLTADPSGTHLWLIGGDYYDGHRLHTHHNVYRFDPNKGDKGEWREYKSKNAPAPRSAHQTVATAQGGGKLWLFGGEFAGHSTFYHFSDFWSFDIQSKEWERIDTKVRPSARSGHRMTVFKNFIILYGGFHDTGVRTTYLDDLWIFSLDDFKWRKIEFSPLERKPSARSGFSFLPCPEQNEVVVFGGFCKTYEKGKRPVAKSLDDCYALKITTDEKNNTIFKWDRRKKVGYVPSLRSGATMAYWQSKNMGVLFAGVSDIDDSEESLQSVFHNDLFGYNLLGGGKWQSLNLRKPKKAGTKKKAAKKRAAKAAATAESDSDKGGESGSEDEQQPQQPEEEVIIDDPQKTVPMPRYNAMLAILRNTLFVFGGIFEQGTQEFTLDDMHSLALDKLERFKCIQECNVVGIEDEQDDDDEDDDDDGEEDYEDEEGTLEKGTDKQENLAETQVEPNEQPEEATQENPSDPNQDEGLPQPGETLRQFFERTKDRWVEVALQKMPEAQAKELRGVAFNLAEEKYEEHKPILREIEAMIRESGAEPIAAKSQQQPGSTSRNRR
ncbi:galactose oxidase [Wallemia mellicola]|nr:galactose oxidase [Wallemia mellicola]TIB88956.1 galactose oxidase [Wallemia mellicola]TIC41051.1 galactose oxidase [Wallemia mellicola]TIC49689.1 galactose oxidase [Wallemia mellicola]